MDKLEVRALESPHGIRVLQVAGPVTLNTLFDLQDAIRKEQGAGLILSLSEVPYMDSAGLGTILGAYASCQRHGRGFALAGVSPRVLTLLQVAKVDSLVPQFETVEAATAALSAESKAV